MNTTLSKLPNCKRALDPKMTFVFQAHVWKLKYSQSRIIVSCCFIVAMHAQSSFWSYFIIFMQLKWHSISCTSLICLIYLSRGVKSVFGAWFILGLKVQYIIIISLRDVVSSCSSSCMYSKIKSEKCNTNVRCIYNMKLLNMHYSLCQSGFFRTIYRSPLTWFHS